MEVGALSDDDVEVAPPCSMLWLDEVRNVGDAVEYNVQPSQRWSSVTSQLAARKLSSADCVDGNKESLCTLMEEDIRSTSSEKANQIVDDHGMKLENDALLKAEDVDQVGTNEDTSIKGGSLMSYVDDDKQDSNEDDRPVCRNVESIDDLRSDLTEVVHIERNKDTNDGDRETSQNIVGIDHLSQDVTTTVAVPSSHSLDHHQDLTVCLSVSKTEAHKKSATNLHLEMDIVADSVNVHMKVDGREQDGLAHADQHLAVDLSYSRSLGDIAHQHMTGEIKAIESGMSQSSIQQQKSLVELSEEGMLLESREQPGLDCIKLKVHVQEDNSTSGEVRNLVTWPGIVNPGFRPEEDDDEARQLIMMHPGESWNAEDIPTEAYNYDSGLPELKIDDGYSDMGDTNEDIRDFRCADSAAEEIDSLMNTGAKGVDAAGDEVDTNEDIRPVFENMAAFDHLSSEVTEESLSKSSSHLDSSVHHSDINLHLSVDCDSLKIGLALTSPPSTNEDKSLAVKEGEFLDSSCLGSCLMKNASSDGAQRAFDLGVLEREDGNIPVKHLYSDELYTGNDSDDSSPISDSVGSNQVTVRRAKSDSRGEVKHVFSTESSESSLLNECSRRLENHSDTSVPGYEMVAAKVCQNNEHESNKFQDFMGNIDLSVKLNPFHRRHEVAGSLELDERVSFNFGTRNNKTVTRSTHLGAGGLTLEADICIHKTFVDSSFSDELGELSAVQAGSHDSMMSASGGHCIVSNESEDSVTLADDHQPDLYDMATYALTCVDTVFWVCLLVTIILFEMCKCYWVFIVPGCLFILSVLVSEHSKPSD